MVRYLLMSFIISILLTKNFIAQDKTPFLQNPKTLHIGIGVGIKYHRYNPYNKDKYWTEGAEKYLTNYAFAIEVAKDFWNTEKHYLGLELIGHPDTYEDGSASPNDFSFILDVFYKRRGYLTKQTKKLAFETAIGLGLFSNDVASMFSLFINTQIKYTFTDYDFFIKNNFRWGFITKNLPWILSVGISIKI